MFLHRVGTSNKSAKKGSKARSQTNNDKRELTVAEDGQIYARVTKVLGDGRFVCTCFGDGATRLAVVRGRLRRRAWIRSGEVVLLSLRAFQDAKSDIIDKYTPDEVRRLVRTDELPRCALADADAADGDGDDAGDELTFADSDDDETVVVGGMIGLAAAGVAAGGNARDPGGSSRHRKRD